ncbi:MAG: tetratricopeptide repeat protein [Candidatus Thiodiazotropha sp.]
MSAYFWNHGHYQSLISVASLIEKSAYELELPDLQAQIRIEHMGGVAARLGREREALESIRTGIAIAKQTGNKFLEVKGLRHLAGIAFKAGDLDGAQAKLEKALEQSEVITEGKHQAEAAAPVHYGFAELLMARGKMTEARSHHDQATQLYALIDDKRRSLKLIPQRATLLEHDGDIDGARALFEEGCRKARALGRVDDVLTSLKGVFRTTALEGQKAKLDREIKIIGRAIGHD